MQPNRRNWLKHLTLGLAGLGLSRLTLFGAPMNHKSRDIPAGSTACPGAGIDSSEARTYVTDLKLGAFSVSLSVKDLVKSKAFYEALGFKVFGNALTKEYLIMKNGNAIIGLFQGMFENNILTFNPGWDENAKKVTPFDDVRKIQKHLKEKGLKLSLETDETKSGPANIMLTDPDGNAIIFDQHV
jgi:predicted lactoylglutathione lyase